MTQNHLVPSTAPSLAREIADSVGYSRAQVRDRPAGAQPGLPVCTECGVGVEQVTPKGPPREKHTPCRCLRRAINELKRQLAEIPKEATPEARAALRKLRGELFALANSIPTQQERDRLGRFRTLKEREA